MIIYVGLGSNLGVREGNLSRAVGLLQQHGVILLRTSAIYETVPWGYKNQPKFLNCVLEGRTMLSPQSLLKLVKMVEDEVGREPMFRWGPRLIDIDILLYGDVINIQPNLEIPHPNMAERAFVLVPLSELVPELVHPTLKVTIDDLRRSVEGKEGVLPWGQLFKA